LRVVVCHGRPVSRLRPRCAITNVTDTEGPTTGANPSVNITGALTLGLQASRLGAGNGRAYTIEIRCADVSGNATTTNEAVRLSPTRWPTDPRDHLPRASRSQRPRTRVTREGVKRARSVTAALGCGTQRGSQKTMRRARFSTQRHPNAQACASGTPGPREQERDACGRWPRLSVGAAALRRRPASLLALQRSVH
jgi:hypothetical protein